MFSLNRSVWQGELKCSQFGFHCELLLVHNRNADHLFRELSESLTIADFVNLPVMDEVVDRYKDVWQKQLITVLIQPPQSKPGPTLLLTLFS